MDYCFLTKDSSDASLTVLVIKGRGSKAILAHPVLCKGRLRDDTLWARLWRASGGSDTTSGSC
eukprot:12771498-Alexandrium_andersonii.AAC.1